MNIGKLAEITERNNLTIQTFYDRIDIKAIGDYGVFSWRMQVKGQNEILVNRCSLSIVEEKVKVEVLFFNSTTQEPGSREQFFSFESIEKSFGSVIDFLLGR